MISPTYPVMGNSYISPITRGYLWVSYPQESLEQLGGGWTNPIEKKWSSKMGASSPSFGVKIPKTFELPPPSWMGGPVPPNLRALTGCPQGSLRPPMKPRLPGGYSLIGGVHSSACSVCFPLATSTPCFFVTTLLWLCGWKGLKPFSYANGPWNKRVKLKKTCFCPTQLNVWSFVWSIGCGSVRFLTPNHSVSDGISKSIVGI